MVTRKFPRYPAQISSILMQRDRLKYNAALRDVSVKGCRVESVIRPFTGMQLEVSLQLPGEATPITITNAAVRWTGSNGIGIEFLTIAPPQLERLNQLITKLSSATHAA
ncbi:MAG: PilZ domain-containing protein [Nitrospira sp.]|mgnify:FL=1|jgi:PilZ domain|nr:MAG: PilZ domain-containing protein [Nitrospira sp. CG24D]TKB84711.1 MAG: PilZ domain-containing protein [Nitrospira sp.]